MDRDNKNTNVGGSGDSYKGQNPVNKQIVDASKVPNTSLKSLHSILFAEDNDGQVTITADGTQIYHGGSWQEANMALCRSFYGIAYSETGDKEFDPSNVDWSAVKDQFNTDPLTALLASTGLDAFDDSDIEQAA